MDIKVKDGMVHITFPVDGDEGPSSSRKTRIVATTRGNKRIAGTDVFIGVNAYRYLDDR